MKPTQNQWYKGSIQWAVFALVFGCLILRVQFCMNGPDESYYLAKTYAMQMGIQPIAQISGFTQFSNILLLPFLWGYRQLTGGVEGIYLASRIAAVVLQTAVSIAVWRWLLKITRPAAALLGAILCQLFIPLNITALSYNSMGLLLFLLFVSLAEPLLRQPHPVRAAAAGLVFALAVIAYPPLVLTVPICFAIWLCCPKNQKAKLFAGFVAGAAVPAVLLIGWLVYRLGFFGLIAALPNLMISDVAHQGSGGIVASVRQYISDFIWWFKLPFLGAVAAVTLLAVVVRCKPDCIWLQRIFWPAFFVVSLWGLVMRPGGLFWCNFKLVPMAVLAPAVFLVVKPKRPFAGILLWCSGILYSIGIALGTDVGLVNASYGFLLCNLAVILWLAQMELAQMPWRIWGMAALAAVLLVQLAVIRFGTDFVGDVFASNTRITQGPSAGMMDTPETVDYYQTTCQVLQQNVTPGQTLFVMNVLPWAYMACDSTPATPDYWIHSVDDPIIQRYYTQSDVELPQVVYLAGKNQSANTDYNFETPLAEAMQDSWIKRQLLNHYTQQIQPTGTVYCDKR